jgi:hypothetical protein
MTSRPEHAAFNKETPREVCLGCHAPDATVAPMPAHHPKKGRPPDKSFPCYACHALPPTPTPASLLFRVLPNREGVVLWPGQQRR